MIQISGSPGAKTWYLTRSLKQEADLPRLGQESSFGSRFVLYSRLGKNVREIRYSVLDR
jgi:hypothetical protein